MWAEVHGGCVSYMMNFVPRKFDLVYQNNNIKNLANKKIDIK